MEDEPADMVVFQIGSFSLTIYTFLFLMLMIQLLALCCRFTWWGQGHLFSIMAYEVGAFGFL